MRCLLWEVARRRGRLRPLLPPPLLLLPPPPLLPGSWPCPLKPRGVPRAAPACPLQEYNSEAAFAAAVLLSFLALFTLVIKDRLEGVAAQETSK